MQPDQTEIPAATPAEEKETPEITEPSHDPIKVELEREQRKGKTEAEKAAFSLRKNAERVRELGLDPEEILGVPKPTPHEERDRPLTVAEYEEREAQKAQKTALQMADEIADDNERELTKHYLEHRIRPSGNPLEDLKFARAAVNSVKNGKILEEFERKPVERTYTTGGGAPARRPEGEFIPTQEEEFFMRAYGLTKEQILKAREKSQQ